MILSTASLESAPLRVTTSVESPQGASLPGWLSSVIRSPRPQRPSWPKVHEKPGGLSSWQVHHFGPVGEEWQLSRGPPTGWGGMLSLLCDYFASRSRSRSPLPSTSRSTRSRSFSRGLRCVPLRQRLATRLCLPFAETVWTAG